MPVQHGVGPDIVIAGSARSGTSFLAALLGAHPQVDPCVVKEPNYFSREIARGPDWYDGLFEKRETGRWRLDASMSYTFAHFPDALPELARTAPTSLVVYAVRHPVARLLSHVQLHRDYFRTEPSATMGEALERNEVYAGASDYAHWVEQLTSLFAPDRVLVVPFPVVLGQREELSRILADASGLTGEGFLEAGAEAERHRNNVVEFRNRGVLLGRQAIRQAGLYPAVRRALGPDRLRRIRGRLTRPVETETLATALAACRPDQHERLRRLYTSATEAVRDHLVVQDARLGTDWGATWAGESPLPGERGTDW